MGVTALLISLFCVFRSLGWQSHAEETVNSNDSDSDESDIVEDVVVPTCSVKQ